MVASVQNRYASNHLQPEPPLYAAAISTPKGQEGVRGEVRFYFPPGGFAPLSTRESGHWEVWHAYAAASTQETLVPTKMPHPEKARQ